MDPRHKQDRTEAIEFGQRAYDSLHDRHQSMSLVDLTTIHVNNMYVFKQTFYAL